jgi:hypothetical protein
MTDAKQALEVAEDLRIGLAEMAASCSVNMETWDRFSNNVLDAASLLSSLAEENERLRGALARIANTGQSAEPDHWKFRVRARAAARQALTTQPEGEGHE